jgi:hypothetical protein
MCVCVCGRLWPREEEEEDEDEDEEMVSLRRSYCCVEGGGWCVRT